MGRCSAVTAASGRWAWKTNAPRIRPNRWQFVMRSPRSMSRRRSPGRRRTVGAGAAGMKIPVASDGAASPPVAHGGRVDHPGVAVVGSVSCRASAAAVGDDGGAARWLVEPAVRGDLGADQGGDQELDRLAEEAGEDELPPGVAERAGGDADRVEERVRDAGEDGDAPEPVAADPPARPLVPAAVRDEPAPADADQI